MLAALAACATADGPGTPTSPPLEATTVSSTVLAALRAAADLPPCPPSDRSGTSESDLPAIELPCLDGGPDVDVAGLVGTPYVVNFWASTCEPCIEEVPYLQALADEAGDRVQVLGVNYLDFEDRALLAAPDFGLRFPTLFDPDGLLGEAFEVPGLPITYFVDVDGAIVGSHVGAFDSVVELRDAVTAELGVDL